MEIRRDITGRTPSVGDEIVYPQCFGGKRYLKKSVVVNIGKKGNPVVMREQRRWNRGLSNSFTVNVKCVVTTAFYVV